MSITGIPDAEALCFDLEQLRVELPNIAQTQTGMRKAVTVQLIISNQQEPALKELALLHHGFMNAIREGTPQGIISYLTSHLKMLFVLFLNQTLQSEPRLEPFQEVLEAVAHSEQSTCAKELLLDWLEKNIANRQIDPIIKLCCQSIFKDDTAYHLRLEQILLTIAFQTRDNDPFGSGFGALFSHLNRGDITNAEALCERLAYSQEQIERCITRAMHLCLETPHSKVLFSSCFAFLHKLHAAPQEIKECSEALKKSYNNPNVSDSKVHINLAVLEALAPSLAKVLTLPKHDPEAVAAITFVFTGQLDSKAHSLEPLACFAHRYAVTSLTYKIQERLIESRQMDTILTLCERLGVEDSSWYDVMQEALLKTLTLCSKDSVKVAASRFGKFQRSICLEPCSVIEDELLSNCAHFFTNVREAILHTQCSIRTIANLSKLPACSKLVFPSSLPDACEIVLPDLYTFTSLRHLIIRNAKYALSFVNYGISNRQLVETAKELQSLVLEPEGALATKLGLPILSVCQNLEHLAITCWSDELLSDVFKVNLAQLRVLKLTFAQKINKTAQEFTAFVQKFLQAKPIPNLEELSLQGPFEQTIFSSVDVGRIRNLSLSLTPTDATDWIECLITFCKKSWYLETLCLTVPANNVPTRWHLKCCFEAKNFQTMIINGKTYTRKMLS